MTISTPNLDEPTPTLASSEDERHDGLSRWMKRVRLGKPQSSGPILIEPHPFGLYTT
jgi:hypothetical protein